MTKQSSLPKNSKQHQQKVSKRWFQLFVLALGGGIIFQLPYLRFAFYTQLMDSLKVNHEQYGLLMTAYASVAMISYFPGGWLADRISPRIMLTFSLIATGISGFYFATFPSFQMSLVLNCFWGLTTILTYWAALLKVTRTLGGNNEQGKLFGLLEGGRGLASAIGAYLLLGVYTSLGEGIVGMSWVIRIFAIVHIVVGIFTWFVIEDPKTNETSSPHIKDILSVVSQPKVWLLCGVIFTTYSIYAVLTYIPPYLQVAFGATLETATKIGIFQRYVMMLIGGAIGGIIADKIGSRSKVLFVSYIGLFFTILTLIILPTRSNMIVISVFIIIITAGLVYVLRGLYFSIMGELNIPLHITGTVIGFASLIGYIPDIYIYTLVGGWLDNNEGILGYRYMFYLMLATAAVGIIIMVFIRKYITSQQYKEV